jgi:hypothetical protein
VNTEAQTQVNPYFDESGYVRDPDMPVDHPGDVFFHNEKKTVAEMINTLSRLINRHMVAQGFWDDEDELLQLLEDGNRYQADDQCDGEEPTDTAIQVRLDRVQGTLRRLKDAEKQMLELTEKTELTEAARKGLSKSPSDHIPEFTFEEEENADEIIRILDKCGRRGLRVGEALIAKLDYNASRPFRHGKKF